MKLLFTVIALGSASLLSADQYSLGGGAYSRMQNSSTMHPDDSSHSQQEYASQGYQENNHQYGAQYSSPNDHFQQGNYGQQQYGSQYYDPSHQYQQQPRIEVYVEEPAQGQYYSQQPSQNQYYSPGAGHVQVQGYQNAPQQSNSQYYNPKAESMGNTVKKGVSDQDISKKIHDELSSGWFSKGFQDVSFDVANGVVDLRGSVGSVDDKNKVEENVRKIDGVKQLNSHINVAKDVRNPNSNNNNVNRPAVPGPARN